MPRIAYTAKETLAINEAWDKVVNFVDNRDVTLRIKLCGLLKAETKNSGRTYSTVEAKMYVLKEIAYGIENAKVEIPLTDLCGIMDTRILAMIAGADMVRRFISTAPLQLAELSSFIRCAEIGHDNAFQRFLIRTRAEIERSANGLRAGYPA